MRLESFGKFALLPPHPCMPPGLNPERCFHAYTKDMHYNLIVSVSASPLDEDIMHYLVYEPHHQNHIDHIGWNVTQNIDSNLQE